MGFQHKHIRGDERIQRRNRELQWWEGSGRTAAPGEENQGVPFATGQSRSLEDQRNSLVQKQPAGSFRSEVGIGLSKIPGCLLRAIKNLRKKDVVGGEPQPRQPRPPRAAGCDSHPACASSLLLLPRTPTPSWGVQRLLLVPLTFPGHRDELELLHGHNPWICVHSQGPDPPGTPGLAFGKMGKPEVRLCWVNPAWKRSFPEPRERGGTLCPTHGWGWEHPGDTGAHKHSLCPCNTTSDKNRL